MSSMTKNVLAGVAVSALVAVTGVSAAHAGIIPAFNLNIGDVANATTGPYNGTMVQNQTNLSLITLGGGDSVVNQNVSNGVAGGAFTETGVIQLNQVTSNSLGNINLGPQGNLGTTAAGLWFAFNLSGTLNADGSVTFAPGGTAKLELTDNNLVTGKTTSPTVGTAAGTQVLATFTNIGSTTGAAFINSNGVPSGSLQLLFQESPVSPTTLFGLFPGNSSLDAVALELGNIQASGATNLGANPFTYTGTNPLTGGTTCPNGGGSGPPGISCESIFVTEQGQLLLTTVPEPATLAIFGASLLGFGWVSRRRNRA